MRGKTPRQIGYVNYYEWALKITKIWQEDTFNHYNYLEEVLNYIRALVQNDVKGLNLRGLEQSFTKEFCKALQKSYCNVSLVVNFGRLIEKNLW